MNADTHAKWMRWLDVFDAARIFVRASFGMLTFFVFWFFIIFWDWFIHVDITDMEAGVVAAYLGVPTTMATAILGMYSKIFHWYMTNGRDWTSPNSPTSTGVQSTPTGHQAVPVVMVSPNTSQPQAPLDDFAMPTGKLGPLP